MITLYTFGPKFGLPDPSPFVMKADMLLKLAKRDYKHDRRGFGKAPKGKLPYIRDDGDIIADSTLIRQHLESKYHINFDEGYDERSCGIAWAVEKLLEDQVYWLIVRERWLNDANFDKGPRAFFKAAPAPLRPAIIRLAKKRIRRNLHGQGLGRHSASELKALGQRAIGAIAAIIGENPCLIGETPCGADATLTAWMAHTLNETFDSDLREAVKAHDNLVAYRDRMMKTYYPDYV